MRELFNPLDVNQYSEDAALEEEDEFGEDVLYDGELLAVEEADGLCGSVGLTFMIWKTMRFSDHYELSPDDQNHIRVCQLRCFSAVLRAGGDS